MKVLHVISRLACHGAAQQLALLQRYQKPSGYDARIVVLNGESAGAREWNGAEVDTIEGGCRLPFVRWWRLRRLLRWYRPQIVHAWDNESLAAVGAAGGDAHIVPGQPLPRERLPSPGWFCRRVLRRANRVLVQGQAEAAVCRACGVPAERLTYVPPAAPAPSSGAVPDLPRALPAGRWIICA